MAYRWKPSASQKKAFAERIKDPEQKKEYEERKEAKAQKRRESSKFYYPSAGGNYIPTKYQYETALKMKQTNLTDEEKNSSDQVLYGYINNEKISHDHIHIVNEWERKQNVGMWTKTHNEIQ